MKVVIINNSDIIGGAAVVSHRLMNALRKDGVDARMLVVNKYGEDNNVITFGSKLKAKYYFIKERLKIFISNGFSRSNLFRVSVANSGFYINNNPVVKDADIIVLNWINQGVLSLKTIRKLRKLNIPVVWIMHDMWECTGICHHAYECVNFKKHCGHCMYLGSDKKCDLSYKTLSRKKRLYRDLPVKFVAVSNWLAGKCRESYLLKDHDIEVIHNAFPVGKFLYERKANPLLADGVKVIVMGAARLDDPVKGFQFMIDAMNYIHDNMPELAGRLHILLYGNIRDKSLLEKIPVSYTFLGRIKGLEELSDIYRQSDIVLSTSLYETLPGTLIEGQASGCIPVTFGNGGQPDIVEHMRTGYIAEYKSARSIAEGIRWAVNNPVDRKFLHDNVRSKFSEDTISEKYLSLFNRLISNLKK